MAIRSLKRAPYKLHQVGGRGLLRHGRQYPSAEGRLSHRRPIEGWAQITELRSGGRDAFVQERLFVSGIGAPDPSDIAFVRAIGCGAFDGDALSLLSWAHEDALDLLALDLYIDALAL
jgi:hypothetical protein